MQLASTPHASQLALLELFAYGTFSDYSHGRAAGKFGDLPPEQVLKLRMLTVATLAGEQAVLDFSALGPPLGLEAGDLKGVEDVVIAAVAAGLVTGRVDQRRGRLEVSGAQVRDVQPSAEAIDALLAKLSQWKGAVAAASASASARLSEMGADAAAAASLKVAFAKQLEESKRAADKEADVRLADARGGAAAGRRRPGGSAGMFGSGASGMALAGDDLDFGDYDGDMGGATGGLGLDELVAAAGGRGHGAARRAGAAPTGRR